MMA
ncbi:hypothetical protein D039_1044A, partial [Vibrio parahaemolyticus EKP-028]|jgi:hypothetical protein